jgi:phage-related protein
MKGGMGSLLNAQVNLTTGLEAEGVQLAKSARSMAAQMGYTGKEMKKVTAQATGLASGLNIGADVAVKAIYNFNWAQKEFQALGIKTASQAAKMAESLGLDPEALAGSLRKATQQFGLTADEAAQLSSSLHAFGKEGGVASKMVMELPKVLEASAGATDQFGRLLKGAELQNFALGTIAAARGLYTFTQNSDEALSISTTLAKKISESREGWNQLMSGVSGGQFPEMNKELMRFGINVDDTFRLMAGSPEDFVKGMAHIQQQIKAGSSGPEEYGMAIARMRGFLTKALGDDQASMMIERMGQSWDKSGEDVIAAMDAVKGAKVDFGKLADESHSTGRTLQENFDRMKEAGVMGFRAISSGAADAFVGATGKEFQAFNNKMQTLAKGGGPLAQVIQKLSLMHQIGAYALIPEALRPMAVLFGEIGNQVLPLLGSLAPLVGGLAPLFVGMGGPMMAVTAAAGLMVVPLTLVGLRLGQLMIQGKTFSKAIDQLGKDIQNFSNTALDKLGKGVDFVYEKFSKVDWKALFGRVFSAIQSVATGDFDIFSALFGKDQAGSAQGKIDAIGDKIKGMIGTLKDGFISAVQDADWGAIGVGLLDNLVYIFIELPNQLVRTVLSLDFAGVLKGLIENVSASFAGGAGAGLGDILVRALMGGAEMATRLYQVMWKVLTTAFELLATVDWSSVASNLWTGLKGAFKGGWEAVAGLGEGVWAALKEAFDWVLAKGPEVAAWLSESIPKWVDMAVGAMEFGESAFTQAQDWVFGLIETLGGYIKTGLEYLWDTVPGWLGSVADWFAGLDWVGMGAELLKGILSLGTTIQARMLGLPPTILGWLVDGLTWVLKKIPAAIDKYLPVALAWIDNLPKMVKDMLSRDAGGDAAGGFIGGIFSKFADAVGKYWSVLVGVVTKLIPALAGTVLKLVMTLPPLFLKMMPILYNVFGQIWLKVMDTARDFVVGLVDGIKNYLMTKFPSVAGPIEVVFEGVKLIVIGAFEVFKWFWFGVITGFEYLWKGIGWVFGVLWDGLKWVGGAIVWLGEAAWEVVKAIGSAFGWVWDIVSSVFTWIADSVTIVWKVAGAAFDLVADIAVAAFEMIWEIAEPVVLAVGGVFQETFDWIQANVIDPVVKWVVDKFMWIWGEAKTIFMGVYKTIEEVFQKVYDKVSQVFVGIQAKMVEVYDGLKTKAEAAMEALKAVMEKPFNILKDTVTGVWDTVKIVFNKIWDGIKALLLGAQGMIGLVVKFMLEKIQEALGALGSLVPKSIMKNITDSVTRAGDALDGFQGKSKAAFDRFNTRVDEAFGHSWDKQVLASSLRASGNMGEFADSAVSDLDRFQQMADKLGIDISGIDPTALDALAKGLAAPQVATDTMATAITQPFLHGAEAADYYAEASMKAFAKVAYGAEMLREVMHDLSPVEAIALRMQQAPAEPPAADGMTARQRELQELSQGPMRELLQATHNPQWYNDWRATFLRAHEELKEELRRLQPTGRSEQVNAKARPMPERDILSERGYNYSRAGI